MTCPDFYSIALPLIATATVFTVGNTLLQYFDIIHRPYFMSKRKPTILPSDDYPNQTTGSLPKGFIPTKEP